LPNHRIGQRRHDASHLLYERYYRGAYATKDYPREVIASVHRLREKYGFTSQRHEHREVVEKLATAATQMSLAI
jgi:hypothetical protein